MDGIVINKNVNGKIFQGTYKNGQENGICKIKYSSGQIYEGEKIDGIKTSYGILYFPNGNIYEGEFKHNKFEGYGFTNLVTFGAKFFGQYKNGKKKWIWNIYY